MWFSHCFLLNKVKHALSPRDRYFLDALNLILYASIHFAMLTMFAKEVMFTTEKTTYIYICTNSLKLF